jgi:hypothetical protein
VSARSKPLLPAGPHSLTLAFYRHLAILVVAAAVLVLLGQAMPIADQPAVWILVAIVLGALAGLISGWYGLIFLLGGLMLGTALDLAAGHAMTAEAADILPTAGPWYLGVYLVAAIAFVAARLIADRFRRGRARDHSGR